MLLNNRIRDCCFFLHSKASNLQIFSHVCTFKVHTCVLHCIYIFSFYKGNNGSEEKSTLSTRKKNNEQDDGNSGSEEKSTLSTRKKNNEQDDGSSGSEEKSTLSTPKAKKKNDNGYSQSQKQNELLSSKSDKQVMASLRVVIANIK